MIRFKFDINNYYNYTKQNVNQMNLGLEILHNW